ncbi:hypothetical protein GALMADRAFT_1259325 [Galerina marginata CBS 339.88]|uniref:Uncharacterized protein n=1 Tax=Galerina marginata (strain CBS 339.88) TaxID=685588 RepID=A0A067T8E3_GALM3|nr:hypothetical protein GALMADRAFT_1259325 [Galerina marginata CBS 339.88]
MTGSGACRSNLLSSLIDQAQEFHNAHIRPVILLKTVRPPQDQPRLLLFGIASFSVVSLVTPTVVNCQSSNVARHTKKIAVRRVVFGVEFLTSEFSIDNFTHGHGVLHWGCRKRSTSQGHRNRFITPIYSKDR